VGGERGRKEGKIEGSWGRGTVDRRRKEEKGGGEVRG